MASFSNWKPQTNYVQSGGAGPGMVDGQFLSGAYLGLFAGPPRLASIGGAVALSGLGGAIAGDSPTSQIVYPIGLTASFSMSQNMTVSRLFELGSERSYFIPGRTVGQLSLSRPMYHGPSLLRVLMAYYQDSVPSTIVPALFNNIGAASMPNPHDVVVPPGYENFFVNLASDLFKQPHGLLAILRDSNDNTYGSCYFESCYVPQYQNGVDSNGVVLQESVGVQYELCVPIASRVVGLIT